jgi:hypothetical protein
MGLIERRMIKELQETTFPYEVDWDSLADSAEALRFIDNVSCHRLNMALRVICSDDMGKQAVRDSLRMVRLRNVAAPADMKMEFQDGVLEMHCAYAEGAGGMFSDGAIRQLLEQNL